MPMRTSSFNDYETIGIIIIVIIIIVIIIIIIIIIITTIIIINLHYRTSIKILVTINLLLQKI